MYKSSKTLAERLDESKTMFRRYPERKPLIIEPKCTRTPPIDKHKYMTPSDLTIGQLIFVIRKRVSLRPDQSMFVFIDNNTLLPPTTTVGDAYSNHKDEDGFLYIKYALENAFGDHNSRG